MSEQRFWGGRPTEPNVSNPPNPEDVGTFWLGQDGKVWQLIAYCGEPTATWARVDAPERRRGGAVTSPVAAEFTRLVPEVNLFRVIHTAVTHYQRSRT